MTTKIKTKHSIFSIFTTIELVVVAALFAAIVLPLPFGYKPNVVMTGSMSPTIPAGSVAWINTNFTEADLEPGTIAVYEPKLGVEVMHRIVAVDPETGTYTFKGDNNNTVDLSSPIAEQVQGIYLFHIPDVGKSLTYFMDNKIAIILLVVGINVAVWALSTAISRRGNNTVSPENKKGASSN